MALRDASLLAAAVLVASACGAAPQPTLHDISSVDQLEAAFERDAGKPRLVLLLSPT
jgi:hypothetical protein